MSAIPRSLAIEVIRRARNRCEYCQLSQVGQEATFHIDHVNPRANGGLTELDNLALACVSCSLRKGAKLIETDPITGTESRLFHPRSDIWAEHFQWDGETVIAITLLGRATIQALAMNRPVIVAIRLEALLRGLHPPV